MECVECLGVASGSGWNLWVWLMGVVVRRYIDVLIILIPIYSSCICSFLQQHPYFLFILKMFLVLVPVLFCNYILSIKKNVHTV